MNQDLLNFIELCLLGGPIKEKEREVIFRKAQSLGVPKDECELILRGMINKSKSSLLPSDRSVEQPTHEIGYSQDVFRSVNENILGYIKAIELSRTIQHDFKNDSPNILQRVKAKYTSKTNSKEVVNFLDLDGSGLFLKKAFRPESMLPEKLKGYIKRNANKGYCVYFNENGLEVNASHWDRKWTLLTIWYQDRVIYHYGEKIGSIQTGGYEHPSGFERYILYKDAKSVSNGNKSSRTCPSGRNWGYYFSVHKDKLEKQLNSLLIFMPAKIIKQNVFNPSLLSVSTKLSSLLNERDLDKVDYNVIQNLSSIENKLNKRLYSIGYSGEPEEIEIWETTPRNEDFIMIENNGKMFYNHRLIESIEEVITDITDFSILCATVINLFELRGKNRVEYKKLLSELEQIGLTYSKFENTVISELQGIREAIESLRIGLTAQLSVISNQLRETNFGLATLNDKVAMTSEKLDGIKSSLDFNNLLTGISIYQNYKLIKK